MRSQTARRHPVRKVILILVVIAACLAALFYAVILPKAEETAFTTLVTEASEGAGSAAGAGSSSVTTEEVRSIYDKMSQTDKKQVRSILEKHLSASNLTKAYSYLKSDNIEGLKSLAQEVLTEEEIEELYGYYLKYQQTP